MKRSKFVMQTLAAAVLSSGLFAGQAVAADSGWYVGGSLGQSKADVSAGDIKSALEAAGATGVVASVDNTDTAWKIFGGYQLNKNLGFELGYVNLGTLSSSATYATPAGSPVRASGDGDGFEFSVVGTLPLTETIAIFGKVGAFAWNVDATATTSLGSVSVSEDGTDLTYGLGANWQFMKNVSARAEWQRFSDIANGGNAAVDMYSVGAVFRF